MQTLGVFQLIGLGLGVLSLVGSFSMGIVAIAVAGVTVAAAAFSSLLFVKWFQGDSKETREGLIKAMWISLLV